jgi:hypothetical protein
MPPRKLGTLLLEKLQLGHRFESIIVSTAGGIVFGRYSYLTIQDMTTSAHMSCCSGVLSSGADFHFLSFSDLFFFVYPTPSFRRSVYSTGTKKST